MLTKEEYRQRMRWAYCTGDQWQDILDRALQDYVVIELTTLSNIRAFIAELRRDDLAGSYRYYCSPFLSLPYTSDWQSWSNMLQLQGFQIQVLEGAV